MAKLILTNEVAGLGSAGDVIEVKNGYARNYLIPQGFAVAWSRGGEKQVASIRAARDARAIHDHEEAVALKDALEANKVRLTVKAGKEGRLFGAVKPADVADAVQAAGLGELDKRKIHLEHPIKNLGEYEVELHLHAEVKGTLKLRVESTTPVAAPAVEAAAEAPKTEKRGKRTEKVEAATEEKPKAAKAEKAPKAEKKAKKAE